MRRADRRALEKRSGAVKPSGVRLRPPERGISLYVAQLVTVDAALAGQPRPGFGLIVTTAGQLRRLGFSVEIEHDKLDPTIGHAHVAAYSPAYDAQGQIPLDLLSALADEFTWLVMPQ